MLPVALVALLTLISFEIVVGVAIAACFVGVVFLAYRCLSTQDSHFLFKIFMLALAIRIMSAAIILYYVDAVNESMFVLGDSGDDFYYDQLAARLADSWASGGSFSLPAGLQAYKGYFYFNGALYHLFGHSTLLARFVNCILGAATVLFVYKIAEDVYDVRVAKLAALLTAVFPSLMLWSSLQYKDTLLTLLVVVAFAQVLRLRDKIGVGRLLVLGASVLSIYTMRMQAALAVALLACGYLWWQGSAHRRKQVGLLVILISCWVAFIVAQSEHGQYLFAYITRWPDFLNSRFEQFTSGQVSSLKGLLSGSLLLPAYFCVAVMLPVPTFATIPNKFDIINKLEFSGSLVWQLLLPFVLVGAFYSIKHKRAEAFMVYSWVIVTIVGLCFLVLIMAPRHRVQIIPFNMILAAVGIMNMDFVKRRLWLVSYYTVALPVVVLFYNVYRMQSHGLL